ncbi:ABC transporter ATP-binding protein [Nocardioides alkalitolerans]|uniref:ABC transporter ATP-binding protein n=1 Tax=Nocardioides alkalitolerans TaxID=281714 RepID=UPI00040368E7|nr:ABC transporter ATP-binding protein [Nocardioides alkalitolerans]
MTATATTRPRDAVGETSSGSGRIEIRGLRKTYVRNDKTVVPAIDDVDLVVEAGEFCVLLGPSGCGKTTLLRCLAGLEEPESGEIVVGGRPFYASDRKVSLTPQQRRLGMVFQSYALWPHMNVERNVAFPMTTRRARGTFGKDEVRRRVTRALETVGIGELAQQPVSALSGGQQQRVALARAIAFGSDVVLFDEPLSNVDAKVRVQLRQEIHALQRELGFTAVYVTHDQEEAMELADVLVVLKRGKVEQAGRPRRLYREPVSRYVADFVGTADILDGTVVGPVASADPGEGPRLVEVATALGTLTATAPPEEAGVAREGTEVGVVVRAEDWRITPPRTTTDGPGANRLVGVVRESAYLGASTQYLVEIAEQVVRVRPQGSAELAPGQELALYLEPGDLHLVTT